MFGLISYFYLFDNIQSGSVLEDYNISNVFTKITVIGLIIMLTIHVPIVLIGVRNSVNQFFFHNSQTTRKYYLTGIILCLGAAALACASDDILIYFDVVGGLLNPIMGLIFPTIFYLRTVQDRSPIRTALAYATFAVAAISMVTCTAQAIQEVIHLFE